LISLQNLYNRLYDHYGPQRWWPADSPFEVIVGAILTQNTNWQNVERAISNLRSASALDPTSIRNLPIAELETLIRPSGFFRQKAVRLQRFTSLLQTDFADDLQALLSLPLTDLRELLLEQSGIGPETADAIVLYAAGKPSFVVDAYTHRILERIGIETGRQQYEQTRALFMTALPHSPELFNEYHALIVRLVKECCRKRTPLCSSCPLLPCCSYGRSTTGN
jgi:endonuclease-3 related protein